MALVINTGSGLEFQGITEVLQEDAVEEHRVWIRPGRRVGREASAAGVLFFPLKSAKSETNR